MGFEIAFSRDRISRWTEPILTYIQVKTTASKWSLVSANNSIISVGQPGDELDLQTCDKISYESNRKWLKSIKFNFFCHFWPVNHLIAFCFCSNLIQWISPWVEHILQVSSSYIKRFLTNRVFSKFEIWHFPIKKWSKTQNYSKNTQN